jgi:hypothetical protein
MKLSLKINHLGARCLLVGFCMTASLFSFAQRRSVSADPHLGAITLTDNAGYQIDEEYVQPNQIIKLKIPVASVTHGQALPAGSCKLKIGFGSKLVLDPLFDLSTSALNNYFKWTAAMNSGQLQITGDLVSALPANFEEVTVAFKVKGSIVGKSTITANFLVTNHNTATILSDEDGANNSSFLHYTVTNKPAPASTITIADLTNTDCSVKVVFAPDKEINLVRYEVEASKDGISFEKVASVNAGGNASYSASFNLTASLQVPALTVRIKYFERTGKFLYSNSKIVNGLCVKLPLQLALYPNPAKGFEPLTIKAVQGLFDGKYKIKMMDITGKTVVVKEITASNVTSVQFDFGNISAGKYLIQVGTFDNVQLGLLKFEKL